MSLYDIVTEYVDCKCTLTFIVDSLQNVWTPFHAACQEGHDQVVDLLLQAGASVDQETEVRCGVGQDCVCETE